MDGYFIKVDARQEFTCLELYSPDSKKNYTQKARQGFSRLKKARFSPPSPSPSTSEIRRSTWVTDPAHPTGYLSDHHKASLSASRRMHSALLHARLPRTQPARHPGCRGFPVPQSPHGQCLHRAHCSVSKQKYGIFKCLLWFHMMCLVSYCCIGLLLPAPFCHFGPRFCLLFRGMSLMEQLSWAFVYIQDQCSSKTSYYPPIQLLC